MTEEEAKTKWCPFARCYTSDGSYNRYDHGISPATACIGAKCMSWRWVKDPLIAAMTHKKQVPDYVGEHGYCGLAGKYDS
jgi:hypothetical protein